MTLVEKIEMAGYLQRPKCISDNHFQTNPQIQHRGLGGSFFPLVSLFNNATEVGQRYFLPLTHMEIFSTDQNNESIC